MALDATDSDPSPLANLFDPRFLLMLLTVAESGSINRAAQTLNISQPALSKNLRDFEARVGAKVLERSQSGTRLTEIGVILCQNARSIRAELARSRRQFDNMQSVTAGTLAIGSSPIGEPYLVPRSIELFLRERPNFRLTVSDASAGNLGAALRRGDIDLLLSPLWDERSGSDLVEEALFFDRMVVAVRSGHALDDNVTISLAETMEFGWVMPPAGLRLRSQIDNSFRQAGIDAPATIIECTQYSIVRNLALSGDWLAALPLQSVAADVADGALSLLPVELNIPPRPIGVITPANAHPSPDLLDFIDCLKQAVAELTEEG